MAKKKQKTKQSQPGKLRGALAAVAGDEHAAARRKGSWAIVAVLLAAATVLGLKALEYRVLEGHNSTGSSDFRIRLVDRPSWMPATLSEHIAEGLAACGGAFYDERLVESVHALGQADPWIRRVVQVRKKRAEGPMLGAVEVRAEYRQPIARVLYNGQSYYVDAEGVRLPTAQIPQWVVALGETPDSPPRQVCYLDNGEVPPGVPASPIHYIVIDGVAEPPCGAGQRWPGDDLVEGLRLVQLIRRRPYANQITVVDVRNHGSRISRSEPQLRMFAQVGHSRRTDIRFGRFPVDAGDYIVSPERKMSYLDIYADENNGLLAGRNDYIDLRYDELHVSIN